MSQEHFPDTTREDKLEYIPALDGIRGLAALLVVFFHSPMPAFQFNAGWVGVNLFFILSGFLITRILINSKHKPLNLYLKHFYIRRILRIFPLYFFYLLVTFCLLFLLGTTVLKNDLYISEGLSDFRRNYAFFITYTYNFAPLVNFISNKPYQNSVFTGHLWTLSVEEQFYFLFPLIIYFVPKKVLKWLFIMIVILVPFLRLLVVNILKEKVHDLFWIGYILYESSIFQLDTLSLGACLALFEMKHFVKFGKFYVIGLIILASIIGYIHIIHLQQYGLNLPNSSLGYDIPVNHPLLVSPSWIINNRYFYSIPLLNFSFFMLLLLIIRKKVEFKILKSKLLVKIGKISYGIYIYHLGASYVFALLYKDIIKYNESDIFLQWSILIIYFLTIFLLANISYFKFECRLTQFL